MSSHSRPSRSLLTFGSIVIAAALVAVVVATAFLDAEPDGREPERGAEIFGEGAEALLAGALRLTVTDGEQTTTLERRDGLWRVLEHDGYPAVQERVAELLERLRAPEVLQRATSDPARFAELGVGSEADVWRRRIIVEGPEGDGRLEIVIGTDRSAPGSKDLMAVHVRGSGSDDVWLVDRDLRLSSAPAEWINRQAVAVERAQLYELRTAPSSGQPIHLMRPAPDAADLQIVDQPDTDVQIEPGALTGPAGALTAVPFDEVRKADNEEAPEAGSGFVRTLDGARLTFWFEELGGFTWVRFKLEQGDPVQSGDSDDDGESAADGGIWTPPHVRLADWAFRLPPYAVERLQRSLADVTGRQARRTGASDED